MLHSLHDDHQIGERRILVEEVWHLALLALHVRESLEGQVQRLVDVAVEALEAAQRLRQVLLHRRQRDNRGLILRLPKNQIKSKIKKLGKCAEIPSSFLPCAVCVAVCLAVRCGVWTHRGLFGDDDHVAASVVEAAGGRHQDAQHGAQERDQLRHLFSF